ncbi:hypothetical protein KR054_010934 [Drosophila jambulina]|nr:hypothetical protein KR054_010934 [Drosophila jambulina]
MPSATFVLEHLMAAQTRLNEQPAAAKVSSSNAITTIAPVAKVKSYEKKLILALKKIVQ